MENHHFSWENPKQSTISMATFNRNLLVIARGDDLPQGRGVRGGLRPGGSVASPAWRRGVGINGESDRFGDPIYGSYS